MLLTLTWPPGSQLTSAICQSINKYIPIPHRFFRPKYSRSHPVGISLGFKIHYGSLTSGSDYIFPKPIPLSRPSKRILKRSVKDPRLVDELHTCSDKYQGFSTKKPSTRADVVGFCAGPCLQRIVPLAASEKFEVVHKPLIAGSYFSKLIYSIGEPASISRTSLCVYTPCIHISRRVRTIDFQFLNECCNYRIYHVKGNDSVQASTTIQCCFRQRIGGTTA